MLLGVEDLSDVKNALQALSDIVKQDDSKQDVDFKDLSMSKAIKSVYKALSGQSMFVQSVKAPGAQNSSTLEQDLGLK